MKKRSTSHLPADFFTPTTGLNGALDGYRYDTSYGDGVENEARLPAAQGISGLPEGILADVEHSKHFVDMTQDRDVGLGDSMGEFLKDNTQSSKLAGLMDLDWLEEANQDPNRLPKNPVDRGLQELWEAWGVERRTDGLQLLPNKDPLFIEDAEIDLTPSDKKASVEEKDFLRVARQVFRKVSQGVPYQKLAKEMSDYFGRDLQVVKSFVKKLAEDAPLLGTVFVRAEAYPGCSNGKWSSDVKKLKATFLVEKEKCESCLHKQEGACGILKKKLVQDIPWKLAFLHHEPYLLAEGRVIPTEGSYETRLKAAFSKKPVRAVKETDFPKQPKDVEVSSKDARAALKKSEKAAQVLEKASWEERRASWIDRQILGWKKKGLLPDKDFKKLAGISDSEDRLKQASLRVLAAMKTEKQGSASFQDVVLPEKRSNVEESNRRIQAAQEKQSWDHVIALKKSGLLTRVAFEKLEKYAKKTSCSEALKYAFAWVHKNSQDIAQIPDSAPTSVYAGEGEGVVAYREASSLQAQTELSQVREKSSAFVEEKLAKDFLRYMNQLSDRGYVTAKEKGKLIALGREEGMKVASAVISHKQQQEKKIPAQKKVAQYDGSGVKNTVHISKKQAYEPSPKEVSSLLKYASKKMNEGSVGAELDSLLEYRFSSNLLKRTKQVISSLRESHEGAAGHLYVDASVYASKEGAAGCEEGALKHRANTIPYVLAMPRCKGCVHRNVEGMCQKYSKPVREEFAEEMVEGYKNTILAYDKMSDAEKTATYFHTPTIVEEFGMNRSLEAFDYDSKMDTEKLGEILFTNTLKV